MTSNLVSRYVVIFIVLALAGFCIATNSINFGIDLRGGSILTYRVQKLGIEGTAASQSGDPVVIQEQELADTIAVVSQRINKEGVKDITVRQEGSGSNSRIVITAAEYSKEQADQLRKRMTQVGELLLAIEANNGEKVDYIDETGASRTETFDLNRFEQQRKDALQAGRTPPSYRGFRWFPERPTRFEKESDAAYKERVDAYESQRRDAPWEVKGRWMIFKEKYWSPVPDLRIDPQNRGFTGNDIFDARRSTDESGGAAVSFKVKESRQTPFSIYTGDNVQRQLCLVLNEEIWSAANIQQKLSSDVIITRGSGGYTKTEQDWLLNCLQSGSLKLRPILESQEEVGATLGDAAVQRGELAFLIGSILVVLFMLLYYRSSGLIAIVALVVNFFLIFAVLMLLQASLTLPGIAGLVLTVGMAVDANILIFERIREEVEKGKKLVHAAKNGFDRAFVTIFDANLTTFIVAVFLVLYGMGPVKGVAYTMMVGIVCTMFAGLYVTRTIYGTFIAKGWISELKMMKLFEKPSLDVFRLLKPFATVSILLVIFGICMFSFSGKGKYGLDFNGGASVRMAFTQATSVREVEEAITSMKGADGKSV
ncbi:MAG: protein translocase subunit SecD, partial [Planctomycetes bacterium]|nr:protein translocase subunit SecD [Planctomycetota bacterium]